jgi:hypothetical protein
MANQNLRITESDLIEFFGKAHSSRDYGTDWFDSDSAYEYSQPNGLKITCAIHPIHKKELF